MRDKRTPKDVFGEATQSGLENFWLAREQPAHTPAGPDLQMFGFITLSIVIKLCVIGVS